MEHQKSLFERIKQLDENGQEYWNSRDLAQALDYRDYRNFEKTLERAIVSCQSSGEPVSYHFGEATEMVQIGSGAKRSLKTFYLTRYACYLVVQNADPSKKVVAMGQTYFATQTRRQELEDQRRVLLRGEVRRHNKGLVAAAKEAGVATPREYAIFQDSGYKGLYDGRGSKDIHKLKSLAPKEAILDHMGSEELAANLFRATQTEAKLRREEISGKDAANQTHYDVGRKVRDTIAELGGAMPEDLPTPDESVKKLENRQKQDLKESDEE